MRVLALADDLSGANEVAAVLAALPRHTDGDPVCPAPSVSATVRVSPRPAASDDAAVTVVNTDNRRGTPSEATDRLRAVLSADPTGPGRALFLKFDSLLRGHIGAQLQAVPGAAPVLFCPAVPELGRTVRDGVLHVDGRPLSETGLWAAERQAPARTVAAQLAPAPTRLLDLGTIRGPGLGEALARAAADGAVAVCDAESAEDLERIAAAGLAQGFVLAGAAGLAAALGRQLGLREPGPLGPLEPPQPRRADVLIVLGTASAAARRQAEQLAAAGVPVHRLRPEQIHGFPLQHRGTVAVTVDAAVDPTISDALTAALTALVERHHADRHLVLSGGETAQAVLAALGVTELAPLLQAHPGAVVGVAADGRLVTTRPGSYGAPDSLLRILTAMHFLQDTTRKVPS
ncbi:four-carbon acid sugar kinase family protein [Kocuria oceani]|uniref:four-carbon acid sugar kinase family protein n=1 Tax=Kocuria oceani TaxID=988827 RepID=UPI00403683FF